jgi:hypothetical protein
MKKYILIILATLSMTSCLNENPKDQLAEEKAYDSAKNLYINTVATLYNYIGGNKDSQGLQGTYRGVYDFNTFTTDEAMLPTRGGDWYDGGFWQSLYLHTWTASDKALSNTWNYLYKVIALCNHSLARIDEYSSLLTASQKATYEAEVRAIRAMYYYYLVDLYARVPLVVSEEVSLKDVKQSTRSDVFWFTVNELQNVAPLLPDEHSNLEGDYYGRVTRPVVYFLLAKLALNAEIFTDNDWTDGTRTSGKNITFSIDGKQAQRLGSLHALLRPHHQRGLYARKQLRQELRRHQRELVKENIFTIPMNKTLYANIFKNLFRSRHYNHGSALGMDSENGSCATLSTVKTYGYGTPQVDTRFDINFYHDTIYVDNNIVKLDNGQPLIYVPTSVAIDLTGDPHEKTGGARMAKYEIDRTAYSDGQLQNNDIVLYRYADVLLMKAEAKVRNGQDGTAELNAVRTRVGMPARKATLATILDERLLELMWEGWRRQDLIRFGKFSSAYDQRAQLDGESNGYTTVFPIPQTAIDLNKNLTQNSGY